MKLNLFVDISLSNFNNAHTPRGLFGGHWQQILYVFHVRKQPYVKGRELIRICYCQKAACATSAHGILRDWLMEKGFYKIANQGFSLRRSVGALLETPVN